VTEVGFCRAYACQDWKPWQALFSLNLFLNCSNHFLLALGTDDKHIAPKYAVGVALAAVKGLHQELKEKDKEIQKLAAEIEELKTQNKNSLAAGYLRIEQLGCVLAPQVQQVNYIQPEF
jgi:hypothetical protein